MKKVRVHINYHVEVDGHYYSVPYQLVKHQLEVRLTEQTVECFHTNQRVAIKKFTVEVAEGFKADLSE
ncbi:hypothetical protein PS928_05018 [Pseudomonas fluorescens]|uniref:Transposase for insertion sequence element IS21-like C-terminal domain-containing protein n=1 Tax=Pseudomonas fluorescens TaxID=294 RepID=A0A5E7VDQ5_PSEFL|nr:hypothetical protein PS928_05018 [Pseudomonas fluorescens]